MAKSEPGVRIVDGEPLPPPEELRERLRECREEPDACITLEELLARLEGASSRSASSRSRRRKPSSRRR